MELIMVIFCKFFNEQSRPGSCQFYNEINVKIITVKYATEMPF